MTHRPPDCGAPAPAPDDPAFLAATQWMVGTAADAAELAEALERMAAGILAERPRPRAVRPHLAVMTRAMPDAPKCVKVYVLDVPFNEAAEKNHALAMVAAQLAQDDTIPVAAAMLTEAWISTQDPAGPRMEPRHDPARREALIIFALANGGAGGRITRLPVRRDPADRMHPDGPAESDNDGAEGRVRPQILRRFFEAYIIGRLIVPGRQPPKPQPEKDRPA